MLYSLLDWLEKMYQPPGFGAFAYISVRSAMAALFALLISLFVGKKIIAWLQKMQLGEVVRKDIGLDSHLSKAGTPSMGGIIIILSCVIPSILWTKPDNIYGWLVIFVMIVLGGVGFLDD